MRIFAEGVSGGSIPIMQPRNDVCPKVLDMEELGMESVWKIEVEAFPAFIVVDDKGNK